MALSIPPDECWTITSRNTPQGVSRKITPHTQHIMQEEHYTMETRAQLTARRRNSLAEIDRMIAAEHAKKIAAMNVIGDCLANIFILPAMLAVGAMLIVIVASFA